MSKQRWMHVVKNNEEVCCHYVMGTIKETPVRPKCPDNIEEDVWDEVLQAVVDFLDPTKAAMMLLKWEEAVRARQRNPSNNF